MRDIPYTDHLGRPQVMSGEEAQAIERSGSCSLRLYQRMFTVPEEPPVMEVLRCMEGRPEKTKQGKPEVPEGKAYRAKKVRVRLWHLRKNIINGNVAACGEKNFAPDIFGFKRFSRMHEHANACPKCRELWEAERQDPNGRKMPKYSIEHLVSE